MVERKLLKPILDLSETPEAIVITGMRRVGKTTLLKQLYDRIPSDNKISIDLENPLEQRRFEELDYEAIMRSFERLGLRRGERAYVFLDEIQYVRNIPSITKYLIDHYSVKFFLTGSASFYLKRLFPESLAGRKRIVELWPFDVEEFFDAKGVPPPSPGPRSMTRTDYEQFQPLYREYVELGGFPGVVTQSTDGEKRAALEEIFTSYHHHEVLGLGDFRNNAAIRDCMLLLLGRIGSRLDVQRLSKELGVSRKTVQEYLAFLEGTYLFSFVRPYSQSRDVEIRSMPKVYCVDSGIAQYIGRCAPGVVFEQAVFQQLRARCRTLRYYQRKSGAEIDFIADGTTAYEAKHRATASDARRLHRLASELGLKDRYVISSEFVSDVSDVRYGFEV